MVLCVFLLQERATSATPLILVGCSTCPTTEGDAQSRARMGRHDRLRCATERLNMTGMQIIAGQLTLEQVRAMAESSFGDLVKAVVDIRRGLLAIDAGMHSDLEALLLDAGSQQSDLWGINLYPDDFGAAGFLEFDSMINLRPAQGNRTRSVEDPAARAAIEALIARVVVP